MSGPNKHPMYPLRASIEELESWKDAAAALGVSLAQWVRDACNQRLKDERDVFPAYFEPKPRKKRKTTK